MTSNPRHEPLYDIDPRIGAIIEVFYADRTLETFGRSGAGWFYWSRQRGFAPDGSATGPFATSYAAYRHALGTDLGTNRDLPSDMTIKSEVSDGLLAEMEGFEPPIGLHLCRISSAAHSTTRCGNASSRNATRSGLATTDRPPSPIPRAGSSGKWHFCQSADALA
jgi:hypothetical protein